MVEFLKTLAIACIPAIIVMKRAASHPVPVYMDSVMLRSLPGCDGLLHSFKYIQIYPSLKIRKAPDILCLKMASAC